MMLAFTQATSNITPHHTSNNNQLALSTKPPTQAWPISDSARRIGTSTVPQGRTTATGRAKTASKTAGPATAARSLQAQSSQRKNLHQTTLWGGTLEEEAQPAPQAVSNRPFRADMALEPPTHHEIDLEEMKTWVYPMNLGPIRDYQFSIVKNGLFNNTLVALPTGLGKTFIAATIMLNYIRWTKTAKAVFVAPTKPLASQQVQACLSIAGIPRSQATLLTGETPPVLREDEWATKRLFFMTPQTLMNDLSKGYADPKSIVLLVIDEAHRATGDYAYVKVVEFLRRFSKSFRILALTATPGSSLEGVQDVIDNLGISHVEIRTEESIDIRQYVHSRDINTITFDPSDEMMEVRDLFSKALKPLVIKLSSQNIYYGRDPMSLTTYGLMKARNEWMAGPGKHVNQGTKFSVIATFAILQSLAHSIKLLNFHGIKPFYNNLAEFRSTEEEKGGKGSKLKRQVLEDENFQKMMGMIEGWMTIDGFLGHPKLEYLCDTLANHFMDAGEGSNTRAIVFSEYRDSAEEIVRILNNQPLTKATVFVGQADSKRSEGMKQKQQIETIQKFKDGVYNVLVATSIGEEGLDIGQVDLIVCYDASASPIRMLQRMGRTGRKRAGNIVLLLMKGKEEDKFNEAKDNYATMQRMICDGSRFSFRHDLSTRIVPRDIRPEVEKKVVEIPLENSQNPELPEPKKSAARMRKKPAKKKFNMPDGVETGFIKASFFGQGGAKAAKPPAKPPAPKETDFIAEKPKLESVLLSKSQENELRRNYTKVPLGQSNVEELDINWYRHSSSRRVVQKTVNVKHGEHHKRCVKLFRRLAKSQSPANRYTKPYGETDTSSWESIPVPPFADDTEGGTSTKGQKKRSRLESGQETDEVEQIAGPKKRQATAKAKFTRASKQPSKPGARHSALVSDCEEGADEDGEDGEESRPRGRGRGGGRKKKSQPRTGDPTMDYGDDCTRTSDMEIGTDGSDDGADLEDFVVSDGEVTSSLQHRPRGSTSPTTASDVGSSSLPSKTERKLKASDPFASDEDDEDPFASQSKPIITAAVRPEKPKPKPFYVPVEIPATQDTTDGDDDLPDIEFLSAKRKTGGTGTGMRTGSPGHAKVDGTSKGGSDADNSGQLREKPSGTAAHSRARKRTVVMDSDDDEE
ncbi:ATP-dependent DNA helicase [Pseudoneurospora amorphoporcata]|uniref:ATP-dependent DNA helicase n=1 Tax=Pseudoneurospora amorphoporcata TaxID=241081 RepID=A0AAN6SF42_9PEZI|nr:ATP-dependent DNA helicase [Pseudoneurospora amorphoporcata]